MLVIWNDNDYKFLSLKPLYKLCFFPQQASIPLHSSRGSSPDDPANLGFLLVATSGAFLLDPLDAYLKNDFTIKEEAKAWPSLCQVNQKNQVVA